MPCALGRGKSCGIFHSYNAVFGLILPPCFGGQGKISGEEKMLSIVVKKMAIF